MPHSTAIDQVPVIDIGPFLTGTAEERQALAALVDRTNREIGFLVVTGHGFDLDLLARLFAVSKRFFEDPGGVKRDAMHPDPTVHQGYHGGSSSISVDYAARTMRRRRRSSPARP